MLPKVVCPLQTLPHRAGGCDRTRTGEGGWLTSPYLGKLDASLQEGAVSGVVGADVAVLAPVAGEGAVHTGQAAAEREKRAALGHGEARVHWSTSWDASAGQQLWAIPHLCMGWTPSVGQGLCTSRLGGEMPAHPRPTGFAHGRVRGKGPSSAAGLVPQPERPRSPLHLAS